MSKGEGEQRKGKKKVLGCPRYLVEKRGELLRIEDGRGKMDRRGKCAEGREERGKENKKK